MEPLTQNPSAGDRLWHAPECAISVAYSPELMDDLRLAVLESFYAFPRGGAEIGGVLFGAHAGGVVRIQAWRDVGCEHALGPSFVLSSKDRVRLEQLLSAKDPALRGLVPAGWFHSHTRSEIFLSEQDQEIHRQYFPEPWQVALVLRPSLAGTQAGFFVRDRQGNLRGDAASGTFPLLPLSGRALAKPVPAPEPVRVPETIAAPAPDPEPAKPEELTPPSFGVPETGDGPRLHRWLLAAAVLLCAVNAIYATRAYWAGLMPHAPASAAAVPVPKGRAEAIELSAVESGGQVRIRWNQAARAVMTALGASLEIKDGGARTIITMHPERLRAGNINYVRQTDRVDVRLDLEAPDGSHRTEFTTLTGQPPGASAYPPGGGNGPAEREELQKQLQEAQTQLLNQELLIQNLQRTIDEMRGARPVRQAPDTAAKPAPR